MQAPTWFKSLTNRYKQIIRSRLFSWLVLLIIHLLYLSAVFNLNPVKTILGQSADLVAFTPYLLALIFTVACYKTLQWHRSAENLLTGQPRAKLFFWFLLLSASVLIAWSILAMVVSLPLQPTLASISVAPYLAWLFSFAVLTPFFWWVLVSMICFFQGKKTSEYCLAQCGWIEQMGLRLLDKNTSNYYRWHWRWQWQVLRQRFARQLSQLNLRQWLAKQRWLWVLLAGSLSIQLLIWFKVGFGFNWLNPFTVLHDIFFAADPSLVKPYAWLLGSLIASPVFFLLWKYRDSNQLEQLENTRKDINLKDFQQLARWATGEQMPEVEVEYGAYPKSRKPVPNIPSVTNFDEEQRKAIASLRYQQSPIRQEKAGQLPDRRAGAESLQVAAVYQLDAFLAGDYGKHFQRPAFQLLCQIWRSIFQDSLEQQWQQINTEMQALIDKLKTSQASNERSELTKQIRAGYAKLRQPAQATLNHALGQALHAVLLAAQGQRLRDHQHELQGSYWAGAKHQHAVLQSHGPMMLDGLRLVSSNWRGADLRGAQLQGADLREAQLQGAELLDAQLQGADLWNVQLQGAYLNGAQLQGADLSHAQLQEAVLGHAQLQGADISFAQLQGAELLDAQLQGAELSEAHLQGAYLRDAQLQEADLSEAQLQGVKLSGAQLQGVDLREAQLQGADCRNITLDAEVRFEYAQVNAQTQVSVWLNHLNQAADFLLEDARLDRAQSVALIEQMGQQGLPDKGVQQLLQNLDVLQSK